MVIFHGYVKEPDGNPICSYMFKIKDIIKAAWIFQPCNMLQESNMKYHTVD